MSPRVPAGLIIRYASHNLRFIYSIQHKELQRVPQDFYRRVKTRTCANPYAQIPTRNPQVYHNNMHQVTQLDIPMSLQISSCKTHIKCSQIIKDSIRQQNLKGKTQFIEKKERGKTPYDSSIATKPVFTSRSFHLKNTREREIQHIATGTYPQLRRRTTPSLSWRPPG